MTMRTVIAVALIAVLCCTFHPVLASQLGFDGGPMKITTTGGANSITVDITVNDTGQVPGCTFFVLTRFGAMVAYFPRQPGVHTFTYTDTDVVPGQLYWYELVASILPIPFPSPTCDPYAFRSAFGSGWGLPFDIPGHVGTDPILLAHGTLVPDEAFWPYVHLEPCSAGYPWYFEFGGLPSGYQQYIGQDVLMYGDYGTWWVQNGWIAQVTSFEPSPCVPVAVENVTWGHVKSLYR